MKAIQRLIILCLSFFLVGCTTEKMNVDYLKEYVDNPHMTSDAKLINIEDKNTSNKGTVKLVQANFKETTLRVGPMKLTFHDVKELLVEPDVSTLDSFAPLTHDKKFHLLKTFVTVENTSKNSLQFNPAVAASTSTHESWTWEQEVYLDELNGLYEPGQIKRGNIGFILQKNAPPTTFTLLTSDVFDLEQEVLATGKEIILDLD